MGLTSSYDMQLIEEDRQLVLTALARLGVERPGWEQALSEIARQIDDNLVLYRKLQRLHKLDLEAQSYPF
jgi:hypothetical protein